MISIGDRDLRGLTLLTREAALRDSFHDTPTLVFASGIVGAGEWVRATRDR
jgi:bifunctional non-homologous end joining protein LigD